MEGDEKSRLVVRTATIDDFRNFIMPNTRVEQWNQHDGDMLMQYSIDPDGYFVAELDGTVVASVSIVRQSPQYAVLGFVLVAPEHRKKGFMGVLFPHALRAIHTPGMTVALDSIVGVENMYEKYGFKQAYKVQCVEGVASQQQLVATGSSAVTYEDFKYEQKSANELYAYDKEFYHFDRRRFFDHMLKIDRFECVVARQEDGKVVGWTMLRPGDEIQRILPLYANSRDIAANLFRAIVNKIPEGEPFCIILPETKMDDFNDDLGPVYNLKKTWYATRMYKDGDDRKEDLTRIWAYVDLSTSN